MTRANGRRDFLSKELVVGTAFSVERTYLGGQFAVGEAVTLVFKQISFYSSGLIVVLTFGGRTISGGGTSNSATLNGWFNMSVGYSWLSRGRGSWGAVP